MPPVYEFQCPCGVRFEANTPMRDHAKPKACPDCGADATRVLPDTVEGVFAVPTSGVGPQNTGISSIDVNIDRIIGEDAEKGWTAINKRKSKKQQVLQDNPDKTKYDLSLNPDGTYRVMKPVERGVHARAVTISHLAMKEISPPR